jgi:hypothetical protein
LVTTRSLYTTTFDRGEGEGQDADPVGAVEHRQVEPRRPVGQLLLDAGVLGEGAPRPAVRDRAGLPAEARAGHRVEGPLVVVLQPDGDVGAADGADLLGHERADEAGRHEVGTVQQRPEHALAEALLAGAGVGVDEPRARCVHHDTALVRTVLRHGLPCQVPPCDR